MAFMLAGCGSKKESYSERLYQAISNNDMLTFEALLAEGGDINSLRNESKALKNVAVGNIASNADYENVYPLEIACQKNTEMAYELLEQGADVSVTDPYLNSTPLIYALSSSQPGRFALAMELIDRGADIDHIDDNKRMAVNLAVHTFEKDPDETREESMTLLKELLDKTDMDEVIADSASNPLREAAKYGNCDAISYILEEGLIDIDLMTDGMTPLMIAVIGQNTEACELLLDRGADPSIVSDEGKTAYDYAKEYDNEDLIKLLGSVQ